MLNCWEWDPSERPTFTEIKRKLSEIYGTACSLTNGVCSDIFMFYVQQRHNERGNLVVL